jgi:putative transposase
LLDFTTRLTKKDLREREHSCQDCEFIADRDVASGLVIENRGIELISTAGHVGIQNAYADGLPGTGISQSRSKSKTRKARLERSRKGTTRKSLSNSLVASVPLGRSHVTL